MMRTKIFGVLAALLLALGCGGRGSDEGTVEEELVLRSYSAPGRAKALDRAIGRLLTLKERQIGRVQVGPGDQLLVLAPRSVHEGLAELIAAQAEMGGEDPASVVMTYWFVAARSGAKDAERAGALQEIEAVLDEIVGVQGPQEFRLVERLELRQTEGENSAATSPRVKINQAVISVSGGNLVAYVEASPVGPNRIETHINLRAGQFLVLGQQALDRSIDPFYWPDGPPRGSEAHAERNRPAQTALYVIVRAEVDPLS